jgi:hypothetical protein
MPMSASQNDLVADVLAMTFCPQSEWLFGFR